MLAVHCQHQITGATYIPLYACSCVNAIQSYPSCWGSRAVSDQQPTSCSTQLSDQGCLFVFLHPKPTGLLFFVFSDAYFSAVYASSLASAGRVICSMLL